MAGTSFENTSAHTGKQQAGRDSKRCTRIHSPFISFTFFFFFIPYFSLFKQQQPKATAKSNSIPAGVNYQKPTTNILTDNTYIYNGD
jgi:hypothetical protein